jgi:hypothetical protein
MPTEPQVGKMEQVPNISPEKEKQSVELPKNGYLDDVLSIFKARQHPFILVEESAMRWMGLRVSPEEVNIMRLILVAYILMTLGSRLTYQRLRNRSYHCRSSRNGPVQAHRAEPRSTIIRYLYATSSSTTTQNQRKHLI